MMCLLFELLENEMVPLVASFLKLVIFVGLGQPVPENLFMSCEN